jgi:arginyl-tRNA synthetase
LRSSLTEILLKALTCAQTKGHLRGGEFPTPIIEITRDRRFGDYATNVAMVLASGEKTSPRKLAEVIAREILDVDGQKDIERAEVAGPGFINLTMKGFFWERVLKAVLVEGGNYANGTLGRGRKIQVEFVSANPTGPLHVGHGRGAAMGDALANVLDAAGFDVQREYYINDAGNQIQTLGRSVYARYLELCGSETEFPEDGYRGDYIVRIARGLRDEVGDKYLGEDPEAAIEEIARYAADLTLEDIRNDLEEFGVTFDRWFSERTLLEKDEISQTLDELQRSGHLYRQDGALWFRTSAMDDDKDRVVIKADGALTYFASDVAYHRNKYGRGFSRVINIWGADHHGYIARMKAGVMALGRDREDLDVLLVQLVNLQRHGKPVAMSTRAGEFVTLREVREEVGRDAARFIFLTRKADSKLDFDLDLAKEKSTDNPVYYVQYAHARICSIIRNARQQGFGVPDSENTGISRLILPEERELIRHLAALPDVIEGAALAMEPHRLTIFLREIATTLHNYYYHHRVLVDDKELSEARLALMVAVKTAVAKALSLLGVSAPERM